MLRTMGEYRAAALDSMRKWVCCVNIKACNRILVSNPNYNFEPENKLNMCPLTSGFITA